ncbi:NRDE family protein [Catellatospora coxensis]
MCTVAVSFEPSSPVPLLVLAVRDELLMRPWEPPAEHWPRHPGLLGGIDLVAGGTWLAVDPAARRAAFVLNGRGRLAPNTAAAPAATCRYWPPPG